MFDTSQARHSYMAMFAGRTWKFEVRANFADAREMAARVLFLGTNEPIGKRDATRVIIIDMDAAGYGQ